ncbi:MAG: hypothetical protein WA924_00040, partial [Burkholderiaceae bacterium]
LTLRSRHSLKQAELAKRLDYAQWAAAGFKVTKIRWDWTTADSMDTPLSFLPETTDIAAE